MEYPRAPRVADCGRSPRRSYAEALLIFAIAVIGVSVGACGNSTDNANWGGAAVSSSFPGSPSGTATLAWDAVTAAAGYRVYSGTTPRTYGQGQLVATNTYQVTGLNGQTTYYFAVTAVDSNGNQSAYSNEVFKAIP
jgi:hypothetical protein